MRLFFLIFFVIDLSLSTAVFAQEDYEDTGNNPTVSHEERIAFLAQPENNFIELLMRIFSSPSADFFAYHNFK